MAIDFTMRVPNVTGESLDPHRGELPMDGVSWGFGRPLSPVDGTPTGKPLPRVVTISRQQDSSSAALGQMAASRKTVASIRFAGNISGTTTDFVYLTLSGVLIESVAYRAALGGSAKVTEELTMSYTRLEVNYMFTRDGQLQTVTYVFTPS